MTILGVSFDEPEVNQAWAEEEGFSFELWTDDDRTLALTYGAATRPDQATASRKTYILDAEGDLVLVYDSVSPSNHPDDVLADCTILFGP